MAKDRKYQECKKCGYNRGKLQEWPCVDCSPKDKINCPKENRL